MPATLTLFWPKVLSNSADYSRITTKVSDLYGQYRNGAISNPIQISNFLKDWLAKHIMETDRQYGPFLNSKGLR